MCHRLDVVEAYTRGVLAAADGLQLRCRNLLSKHGLANEGDGTHLESRIEWYRHAARKQ